MWNLSTGRASSLASSTSNSASPTPSGSSSPHLNSRYGKHVPWHVHAAMSCADIAICRHGCSPMCLITITRPFGTWCFSHACTLLVCMLQCGMASAYCAENTCACWYYTCAYPAPANGCALRMFPPLQLCTNPATWGKVKHEMAISYDLLTSKGEAQKVPANNICTQTGYLSERTSLGEATGCMRIVHSFQGWEATCVHQSSRQNAGCWRSAQRICLPLNHRCTRALIAAVRI
jgi:hypothetical protein